MSRTMERFISPLLAGGADRVVVTVPAHHKFEILTAYMMSNDVAITGAYSSLVAAMGAFAGALSPGDPPPANTYATLLPWVPQVLYEGDHLNMTGTPGGLHYYVFLTYIDVDFSG